MSRPARFQPKTAAADFFITLLGVPDRGPAPIMQMHVSDERRQARDERAAHERTERVTAGTRDQWASERRRNIWMRGVWTRPTPTRPSEQTMRITSGSGGRAASEPSGTLRR